MAALLVYPTCCVSACVSRLHAYGSMMVAEALYAVGQDALRSQRWSFKQTINGAVCNSTANGITHALTYT